MLDRKAAVGAWNWNSRQEKLIPPATAYFSKGGTWQNSVGPLARPPARRKQPKKRCVTLASETLASRVP